MSAVTNNWGVAVSGAAGSSFRLRPSGFCAPERPLLQRRLAGRGWICAIYTSGSGYAAGGLKLRTLKYDRIANISISNTLVF